MFLENAKKITDDQKIKFKSIASELIFRHDPFLSAEESMPSKQRLKTDSLESDLELIRASGVVWPDSAKVTPMMRQWLQAKKQSPSSILLFRMGDFYELFGEDAERAAPILELTLTSRDKGKIISPWPGFLTMRRLLISPN